jgi:sialidase-1
VASDSSPNSLHGTYRGEMTTYSDQKAPTRFGNEASRRFTGADQAVELDSAFARLRPTTGITVSVWFRTSVTTRTDLVAFNMDYFIRYMPPELEFTRRKPPNATGTQNFINANAVVTANDDRWHHVAGRSRADETTVWLDGVRVGQDPAPAPFLYTAGNRLSVGRAIDGSRTFTGWLDDLRIYDRILSDDEIRALARGEH